jgi:hypothetical protein
MFGFRGFCKSLQEYSSRTQLILRRPASCSRGPRFYSLRLDCRSWRKTFEVSFPPLQQNRGIMQSLFFSFGFYSGGLLFESRFGKHIIPKNGFRVCSQPPLCIFGEVLFWIQAILVVTPLSFPITFQVNAFWSSVMYVCMYVCTASLRSQ